MPPDAGMVQSEEELYAEADELFDELDVDGSADLDKEEVVRYLVEYGYTDPEAATLVQKMQLHGAGTAAPGATRTVSKAMFREIYAVFISDLAERGQDIAMREQDRVLTKRGFPPGDVAAYTSELMLNVADNETVELISACLATRWEEALRARGYSEQAAVEAAMGLVLNMVEEEITHIVRPEVAGRAEDIRRYIDKKLAHMDITEKITKDVRRDLIMEVIEEELVSMTMPQWRILHPAPAQSTGGNQDGELGAAAAARYGGEGQDECVDPAEAEAVAARAAAKAEAAEKAAAAEEVRAMLREKEKREVARGRQSSGMLLELINATATLCASARRAVRQPMFFLQLETARALERCTAQCTHDLLEEVLVGEVKMHADRVYRIMLREKAETETNAVLDVVLDKVAVTINAHAKEHAKVLIADLLELSYRRWRSLMTVRLEEEALEEQRIWEERAERKLRAEEDRQISAAVYSLEHVSSEEDMYQSHDTIFERELTVTPRYGLERKRIGGVEWGQHAMGKQWVQYHTETQVKHNDPDTVRRVRDSLDPANTPVQRQTAVRMLAQQVRAGDATMTPFFIDLLSDDDKVVQRLALEAISSAVASHKEAAIRAGMILIDKGDPHLRICGIKALEHIALKEGTFDILQPLVWLVDDRTRHVQKAAVDLLCRCLEAGASSGSAVKEPAVRVATPPPGGNANDYKPGFAAPKVEVMEKEKEEEVEKVDWKQGYEVAILRLVPLLQDNDEEMRRLVARAMCCVIKTGDKRVAKMIRPLLKNSRKELVLTAVTALSGALTRMDPHTLCYLPTRDELENDDLQVKDAAKRQQKIAKDSRNFLKGMHECIKSEDPTTRKYALEAVSPLVVLKWPETLQSYLQALEDENASIRVYIIKQVRRLGPNVPDDFISPLLLIMTKDEAINVRLAAAETLQPFAARPSIAQEFVKVACDDNQDQYVRTCAVEALLAERAQVDLMGLRRILITLRSRPPFRDLFIRLIADTIKMLPEVPGGWNVLKTPAKPKTGTDKRAPASGFGLLTTVSMENKHLLTREGCAGHEVGGGEGVSRMGRVADGASNDVPTVGQNGDETLRVATAASVASQEGVHVRDQISERTGGDRESRERGYRSEDSSSREGTVPATDIFRSGTECAPRTAGSGRNQGVATGQEGDEEEEDPILTGPPNVLSTVVKAVHDESTSVRLAALQILVKSECPAGLMPFCRALADENANVQVAAAAALQEAVRRGHGQLVVEHLLSRARRDWSPQVREACLRTLIQGDLLKEDRVREALLEIASSSEEPNLRRLSVLGLGRLGDIASAAMAILDSEVTVRLAALHVACEARGVRSSDEGLGKKNVAPLLSAHDQALVRDILVRALEDRDEDLRGLAAKALATDEADFQAYTHSAEIALKIEHELKRAVSA
jgi:HEAT repeat protein